jgi:hypothetical protein
MNLNIFKALSAVGQGQTIWIYPTQTSIKDPYENTEKLTFLNPVPVNALVRQYKPESLRWKFYGQIPVGSKEAIINIKYKNLIKLSRKIKIGKDYFKVWKDDERGLGIIERADYLVIILAYKGTNISDD